LDIVLYLFARGSHIYRAIAAQLMQVGVERRQIEQWIMFSTWLVRSCVNSLHCGNDSADTHINQGILNPESLLLLVSAKGLALAIGIYGI